MSLNFRDAQLRIPLLNMDGHGASMSFALTVGADGRGYFTCHVAEGRKAGSVFLFGQNGWDQLKQMIADVEDQIAQMKTEGRLQRLSVLE